jgi:hypothetical protein
MNTVVRNKNRPYCVLKNDLGFRLKDYFGHVLPVAPFPSNNNFRAILFRQLKSKPAKFFRQSEKAFLHENAVIRKTPLIYLKRKVCYPVWYLQRHPLFPRIFNVTF